MKRLNFKIIIIKTFVLLTFVFVLNLIGQTIAPVAQNEIAMMQMKNTVESSMSIQFYSYIKNYSWIATVFIAAMLFYREIKFIFNKIKEFIKNENNN